MGEIVTITFRHDGTFYGHMPIDIACHHLAKSLLNRNTKGDRYEIKRRLLTGEKINTTRLSYEVENLSNQGT